VLSRCQRHEFRRVPLGEITRHLTNICKSEGIQADPEALNTIARQSTGGMRDAISLLDQLASTGGKITLDLAQTVLGTATSQSVLALIQAVIDHQPGAGLDEIQRALDGGADARALSRQVVEYLRNIMLIKMGNGAQVEVSNDTRAQWPNTPMLCRLWMCCACCALSMPLLLTSAAAGRLRWGLSWPSRKYWNCLLLLQPRRLPRRWQLRTHPNLRNQLVRKVTIHNRRRRPRPAK